MYASGQPPANFNPVKPLATKKTKHAKKKKGKKKASKSSKSESDRTTNKTSRVGLSHDAEDLHDRRKQNAAATSPDNNIPLRRHFSDEELLRRDLERGAEGNTNF